MITYAYFDIRVNQTALKSLLATKSGRIKSNQQIPVPLPLVELVRSDAAANYPCPVGTAPILDTIADNELPQGRRIPKVVHITSKSRCATPDIIENVNLWRMNGYSLYFHDDEAVERLNSHPFSQQVFPLLNETLKCVTNGMAKSDLWRYLVLWTYGGIYADIDSRPNEFNETTIKHKDDFFGVIDSLGILAQFFLASSPHHPLMRFALDEGLNNLRGIENVMKNQPSLTTGPKALKVAFINFMNKTTKGYILEGKYGGVDGRTITVKGSKYQPQQWIQREGIGLPKKTAYYRQMGIEHFHTNAQRYRNNNGAVSCMEHLKRTKGTNKVANYTYDGKGYFDEESMHTR
jgi:hypothetical protein